MSTLNGGPGNIVTNGLVMYLDAANYLSYTSGSTTWRDLSPSNLSGSLVNGPTFNSGNAGSIVFDGSNDYVTIPNNTALSFTGSVNLSSEVWIKFSAYKDITFVNAKGDGSGAAAPYNYFFIGTSTAFYFRVSDGTTVLNSPVVINQTNLPAGVWGHVVAVVDSSFVRIYLNGIERGTPIARTINPKANNQPFLISTPAYVLSGSVAISRIYNRALTAQEVLQNYNAQKTRFGLT